MVGDAGKAIMKTIKISIDFSGTPIGRYDPADGKWTGEKFRRDLLVPALETEAHVCVDLDGAEGYGSSFLEEAFGGLVRKGHFTAAALHERLSIKCDDPSFKPFKSLIWSHIDKAKKEESER